MKEAGSGDAPGGPSDGRPHSGVTQNKVPSGDPSTGPAGGRGHSGVTVNEVRSGDASSGLHGEGRLRITEIYRSLQGESTWTGLPCTFVRLTGCALRCVWCDSTYTFTGGRWMTVHEIHDQVRAQGSRLVEITGGEPLLQEDVHVLIGGLCDEGYEVLVETGGDQDISRLDARSVAIMDVKCPGSGMTDRMDWANLERLRPRDELKFVIAHREDYEWARDLVRARGLGEGRTVLFSCAFGLLAPRDLAQWLLEDDLRVRLQLQMHKILWDPDERGR